MKIYTIVTNKEPSDLPLKVGKETWFLHIIETEEDPYAGPSEPS